MKRKLIIADSDIDYAIKLLEQFSLKYRDVLDIHIITDPDYFYEYFSQSQHVDILVASEEFRTMNLGDQEIERLFWMTENQNVDYFEDQSEEYLYKYSSLQTLMSRLCTDLRQPGSEDDTAKLVVVTSASGGTGKSTVATVLASMQRMLKRKALYFNVSNIQNFSHLFRDQEEIPLGSNNGLAEQIGYSPYGVLSQYIRTDGCDYLPSFDSALSQHEIPLSCFVDFVDQVRNDSDYDVIIADVGCGDSEIQKEFFKRADHSIVVSDESRGGIQALNKLLPLLNEYKGMEVSLLLNKAHINNAYMNTMDVKDQKRSPFSFSIEEMNSIERLTSRELIKLPAFRCVINLCY